MSKRRSTWWTVLAVVLLLAGALVVYRTLFMSSTVTSATIIAIDGRVMVVGPSGEAVEARTGQAVEQGSSIQTDATSRSAVRIQGATVVNVDEDTAVVIDTITSRSAKLTIERGRVRADVAEDSGQTVEFGAKNTDARVRSSGGRLAVAADGYGAMQVTSESGTSEVSAGGETVELAAGEQVVVTGDEISEIMDVPESLLLKVAWPELPEGATRSERVPVQGQASPGTVLDVNGQAVAVKADGHWQTEVALEEGSNTIKVRARDAKHDEETSWEIKRDTRGPPLQAGKGVWK